MPGLATCTCTGTVRVCGLDEIDMSVQRTVGQRLGGDLDLLAAADLGQLVLVDIGFNPDLAQVGDGEERVACVDVLPLGHLAVDHASRCGGV